jgi:hypothetical protein
VVYIPAVLLLPAIMKGLDRLAYETHLSTSRLSRIHPGEFGFPVTIPGGHQPSQPFTVSRLR